MVAGPRRTTISASQRSSSKSSPPLIQNGLFDPTSSKPFKNPNWTSFIGSKRKWKNIKGFSSSGPMDSLSSPWSTMDPLPSLQPSLKYCDVTGLEMQYIDPKSGLRYSGADTHRLIRKLTPSQVQDYLAIRNASFMVK